MELQPAPTSSKNRLKREAARFDQPGRVPWAAVWGLSLFMSLIVTAGSLAGLAWLLRSYPDASWLRPWSFQSTTVIERLDSNQRVTRPARTMTQTLLIASTNHPDRIEESDIRAVGLPLSANGWILSLRAGLPNDGDLVAVTNDGKIFSIEKRVDDPAGIFVYLKISDLSESPASFTPLTDDVTSQRTWLGQRWLGNATSIETRLGPRQGGPVESSDHLNMAWLLAGGQVTIDGEPLMDDRGYVFGLVDRQGQVWPTNGTEPVLKTLLQNNSIERPSLGINALDLSRTLARTTTNQPDQNSGWLLQQTDTAPAVEPKGAGDVAGLQANDRILTMDGEAVAGPVWVWLQHYHAGQTIDLKYERGNIQREARVELGSVRP